MRLSVLIVSYNAYAALRRCLASLAGQPADVVVVDNASPDGSAALATRAFPSVRVVAWSSNRGFAAAVNAAARLARGDAFLLLNPDTELPADALMQMRRSLIKRPEAAALGFRQVDAAGRFQLAVGPRPTLAAEWARRWVQRRIDAGCQLVPPALDWLLRRPTAVSWVAGSSLLVRRHVFEAVGGFDEGYFLFFEDIDFCLRLAAQGHRVFYDPSVTILHHRGVSAASAPSLARRAYRTSQLRFWQTHRGVWMRRAVQAYLQVRGEA